MQHRPKGVTTEVQVAFKAAALGILLGLGATQAMAQPGYYYYRYGPPSLFGEGPIEGLSTREIARTVRAAGLRPIARPRRVGPNYIVSSVDRYGVVKRVVIDAEMGEIITIRAASGPIGAANRSDRPPPRSAGDGRVAVYGPDADMPAGRVPPARKRENARVPMPVPRSAIAALPKEADTESLPQAEGAAPAPSVPVSAKSEDNARASGGGTAEQHAPPAKPEPRSAAVTPAKPSLPAKRPAEATETKPAAPVRVVLPGGPGLKGEAAAGKPETTEKAEKEAAEPENSTLKIVPPQSYE